MGCQVSVDNGKGGNDRRKKGGGRQKGPAEPQLDPSWKERLDSKYAEFLEKYDKQIAELEARTPYTTLEDRVHKDYQAQTGYPCEQGEVHTDIDTRRHAMDVIEKGLKFFNNDKGSMYGMTDADFEAWKEEHLAPKWARLQKIKEEFKDLGMYWMHQGYSYPHTNKWIMFRDFVKENFPDDYREEWWKAKYEENLADKQRVHDMVNNHSNAVYKKIEEATNAILDPVWDKVKENCERLKPEFQKWLESKKATDLPQSTKASKGAFHKHFVTNDEWNMIGRKWYAKDSVKFEQEHPGTIGQWHFTWDSQLKTDFEKLRDWTNKVTLQVRKEIMGEETHGAYVGTWDYLVKSVQAGEVTGTKTAGSFPRYIPFTPQEMEIAKGNYTGVVTGSKYGDPRYNGIEAGGMKYWTDQEVVSVPDFTVQGVMSESTWRPFVCFPGGSCMDGVSLPE